MFIDWPVASRPGLIEVFYVSIVGLYWSSMTGNDISWGLGLRTLPRIQANTKKSRLLLMMPQQELWQEAGGSLMSGRSCRGRLCWPTLTVDSYFEWSAGLIPGQQIEFGEDKDALRDH